MIDQLERLAENIVKAAKERGLPVYRAMPHIENVMFWEGDWTAFLDLAVQVQAPIFYFMVARFDAESAIEDIIQEIYGRSHTHHEVRSWLQERVAERMTKWETYKDQTEIVQGLWRLGGKDHCLQLKADWLEERDAEIRSLVEEISEVEEANRVPQSDEDAKRLYQLAEQMARHKRYTEATNDVKRAFMAEQLFPDELVFTPKRIAERAQLYYWWFVEPGQQATKAEQAAEMYEAGDSIKNIAAILKMSEAKVRRAIEH